MSREVVALCRWTQLVPGSGRVVTASGTARASLAERRLTVFGLFTQPEKNHCRVARYSAKPPMRDTYFIHLGLGRRVEIRLTELPTITGS